MRVNIKDAYDTEWYENDVTVMVNSYVKKLSGDTKDEIRDLIREVLNEFFEETDDE